MWCPIAELVGEEAAWYIRVSILVFYLFLAPMPACISQFRQNLLVASLGVALICLNIIPYCDTVWNLITAAVSSFKLWVLVLVIGGNVYVAYLIILVPIKPEDQLEVTNSTNTKDQQPSATTATTTTEGSKVAGVATPNCGSAHINSSSAHVDSHKQSAAAQTSNKISAHTDNVSPHTDHHKASEWCCCSMTRQQLQSLFREILLEENLEWRQKAANKQIMNTTAAAQQPTAIERENNAASQQENCLQQEMQKLRKETKKQTELLSNYLEFIFDQFESESVKETSPEIIMDEAEQKQQLNGQLDGQLEVEDAVADANTEGCGEGSSDKDKCHDCNIVSHSNVESECHAADGDVTAADVDDVDTSPLLFCTWKSLLARRARATAATAHNNPASRSSPSFSPWKNFARRKQKLSQDRQKRLFQPYCRLKSD